MTDEIKLIRSSGELNEYFFNLLSGNPTSVQTKRSEEGVLVDSKIRKEVLISATQGKIVIKNVNKIL
jgi:hypothetical protein